MSTVLVHDEVSLASEDGILDLLQGMIDRVANPVFSDDDWASTVEYLEELHQKYFDTQSGPDGSPWERLSPLTVSLKGHDKILIDTEELMLSLTQSENRSAVREMDPTELRFGTRRAWAWVHQEGVGLPQRIHTGLSESSLDDMVGVVADAAVLLMFGYIPPQSA